MPLPEASPFQQPSETVFLNAVNDFWYHTVWTAKHLRRGELWWAKSGCDDHLKGLLRQVLEWHTHAMHSSASDTWMRGRFLEEWADPRAVKELAKTFAHYDKRDITLALVKTMDLFRWLSKETADQWKYSYPVQGADTAAGFVEEILEGMN
jgi:aminoglycoside 6-adenylyltransferase